MSSRKKYYVVFKGHNPGVYDTWDEVKEQTHGFPGAVFKGYVTSQDAADAYRNLTGLEDRHELLRLIARDRGEHTIDQQKPDLSKFPEIDMDAWAVDASCMGNPGVMEYRCVELKTGKELFRMGPFKDATNNIGEYLAIVHAMALMTQKGEFHNIYSDSDVAQRWVRRKAVNTSLKTTENNTRVFELLARASIWVKAHTFPCHILKWQTIRWGEIPADFGRK